MDSSRDQNQKHSSKTYKDEPLISLMLEDDSVYDETRYSDCVFRDCIRLDVQCPEYYHFPEGTYFHPMIWYIDEYMHLIRDEISVYGSNGPSDHQISRITIRGRIENIIVNERMSEQKDGSWKGMLLCVPPVQSMTVAFGACIFEDERQYYSLYNNEGITMGQLVRAFRDQLNMVHCH